MSISRIKNIVTLTGENPDYEDIARVFPYYPEEKRNGANFLECILLLSLRVTLKSGSLFMLSKEEITDNNKYTARKNRDKVIKTMHSTILFELFSHAFYDIFELTVNKRHQKIAEESIRRVWLPENLKDRKDAFSAFERYKARFKGNLQFDCREYRLNHMMIDDKIVSDNYAYKLVKDFNEIDLISTVLLPMSFHFLTENSPEYFDFTDENTNKRAINYANIIREYINLAIEEATDILNKMCEEILEFNEG